MPTYISQVMVAAMPGPPLAIISDASGQLFLPEDTSYSNPVTVQTLDGTDMVNVDSTELGFLPALRLPAPVMIWKSGPYTVPIVTVQGAVEAAEAAAAQAESAAEEAAEARAAAESATSTSVTQIDNHLGGDASNLVLAVANKADLDPGTGKLVLSQMPDGAAFVDATPSVKGAVQLAGDLGGTAAAPTVPGLANKAEDNVVVKLSGAQTIAGVKTFTAAPVVPDGSFAAAKLAGSGTRDATTALHGDGVWRVPAGAGGTPSDNSVTNSKVAPGAGILLSKTADDSSSSGRLAMTNAERNIVGQTLAGLAARQQVVYYSGSSWPTRPSDTAVVIWNSTKHASAPAPSGQSLGDIWQQHPDAA